MEQRKINHNRLETDENKEMLADLYAHLECPVCSNYMAPPIPECVNRHSICKYCFQKVTSCPLCRAPKYGHGISFVLGEIYDMLIIPCRFRDRGCQYSCKGEFLYTHENICNFRTRLCPLKKSQDCFWEGTDQDIRSHLCSRHPANSCIDQNRETFVLTGFRENRRYRYFTIIFSAYEKLFRLTWNIDRSGITKWAVYYVNEDREASNFAYELVFHRRFQSRHSRILIWRSPCTDGPANDSYIIHSKCFYANINLVDLYCTGVGELCFTVTIHHDPDQNSTGGIRTIFRLGFSGSGEE